MLIFDKVANKKKLLAPFYGSRRIYTASQKNKILDF